MGEHHVYRPWGAEAEAIAINRPLSAVSNPAVDHRPAGGVTFLDSGDLTANQSAATSDISQTITQHGGTRRIKLHDKPRALEMLGRYFSLFTDKVEHTHRSQIRVTEIREHYSVYPEEDE